MSNMLLSICIPTFNRNKYLERLLNYASNEDTTGIEFVIVNDGSTDATRQMVSKYKNKLQIKYEEQENAGRSNALLKAINLASGEYAMVMDDEDLFVSGAFEVIKKKLANLGMFHAQSRDIIGVVFLTEDIKGEVIGKVFPKSSLVTNLVAINADFNNNGDKKQIVRTNELRKVLYSTFPGERRMSTYVLWARLARQFDVVFFNEVIVIKEYLPSGLSKNINEVRMKSPRSSRLIYKELLEMNGNIYKSKKYRLKNAINFYRYNFHCPDDIKVHCSIFYKLAGGILGFIFYKQDVISSK